MSEDDIDRLVADPTQIDQFGDTKADVLGSYCKGIRNIFIMLTACAGCAFFVSFLIEQRECEFYENEATHSLQSHSSEMMKRY